MASNEQYMKLKISEIFRSIQGESSFMGLPCVFIRLSGCNLRCRYCDTAYAWSEGYDMPVSEIVREVLQFRCNLTLITGGEPLMQPNSTHLAQALIDVGLKTLVETNGSIDISNLPEKTVRIVDVKCPGSGEVNRFYWGNLGSLRPSDEIKFVITSRYDYEWTRDFVHQHLAVFPGQILLSPAFGKLDPKEVISWILEDNLNVRFQLQLHKIVWGPTKRGV